MQWQALFTRVLDLFVTNSLHVLQSILSDEELIGFRFWKVFCFCFLTLHITRKLDLKFSHLGFLLSVTQQCCMSVSGTFKMMELELTICKGSSFPLLERCSCQGKVDHFLQAREGLSLRMRLFLILNNNNNRSKATHKKSKHDVVLLGLVVFFVCLLPLYFGCCRRQVYRYLWQERHRLPC